MYLGYDFGDEIEISDEPVMKIEAVPEPQQYLRVKPDSELMPPPMDHSYAKPMTWPPVTWHIPQLLATPRKVVANPSHQKSIGPYFYILGDQISRSKVVLAQSDKTLSEEKQKQKIASLLKNLKRLVYCFSLFF